MIKNIIKQLFFEYKFLSTQIRFLVSISLLLLLLTYSNKSLRNSLLYIISVLYYPLIVITVFSSLALSLNEIGYKSEFVENELSYFNSEDYNYNINLGSKFLLLFIIYFIKTKKSFYIFILGFMYILLYDLIFSIEKNYKMTLAEKLSVGILSLCLYYSVK